MFLDFCDTLSLDQYLSMNNKTRKQITRFSTIGEDSNLNVSLERIMASTLQQIVPDKPSRYGSGIKAIEKENLSKTLKVALVNAADGNLYV